MARLGPFSACRRIGVAVSGGADSMALAMLLRGWGLPLAFVVDHGLRPESGGEAGLTMLRLAALGIPARLLHARLQPGSAAAARARAARYALLAAACRDAGCADLALGHHQRDQAETLLLRQGAASGPAGLAGMALVTWTDTARLLRPLLGVAAGRLRTTLAAAGVGWVEDPTNCDLATPRARLRAGTLASEGAAAVLAATATGNGVARAAAEAQATYEIASSVNIYPEGIAHLRCPVGAQALSALVWMLSGAVHPPPSAGVARLLAGMRANPRHAATLHGACLIPARASGEGWLLGREAAGMQGAVPIGERWDGRFLSAAAPDDLVLGPLGKDAARLRRWSPWPAALLHTLPTLRKGGAIVAAPHLGYPDAAACRDAAVMFRPARPAAPAAFVTS